MTEDMHDTGREGDRPSAGPPAADFSNQFLLAMPALGDGNFAGSVVYVCEHTSRGALGLVINRPTDLTLADLFERIEMQVEGAQAHEGAVYYGGPVQTDRGFVLHATTEASYTSSIKLGELTLTTSRDILQAVAEGTGPQRFLVTLGYAGWGAGQLEYEMSQNAWLNVDADARIIFDVPPEARYPEALKLLGVDPIMLSGGAGHA